MQRWEAEQIFNDVAGHYLGIRADGIRRAYLDKLEKLDAARCAQACELLVTRLKRFPSVADIFEATRGLAPTPAVVVSPYTPHPDGPLVPREEGQRRLRAIVADLLARGRTNPFAVPERVPGEEG